nr:MAG TPA: hypothetical protein [Caudoviricetes sp.]
MYYISHSIYSATIFISKCKYFLDNISYSTYNVYKRKYYVNQKSEE